MGSEIRLERWGSEVQILPRGCRASLAGMKAEIAIVLAPMLVG